jgi:atypical dual specificity phosphatase
MPRHHRHVVDQPLPLALIRVVGGLLITFGCGYILLEKKMLPKKWWAALSRIYFYPMMLPNLFVRLLSARVTGNPYFSDVDEGVMVGAVPMVLAGHVAALHHDGVRAVVNLQAEYAGPLANYQQMSPPIETLHLPVVDHTEPTVEDMQQAVAFIARHRAQGSRVLVHCKGGHGRSAAVAAAWLMSPGGGALSPKEAQIRLSSSRSVRKSLHTQPALLEYYRLLQAERTKASEKV